MLWHQAKVKLQKLWILWCQVFRNSISKHKLIFNHFQITVTLNFGKQIEANWKNKLETIEIATGDVKKKEEGKKEMEI